MCKVHESYLHGARTKLLPKYFRNFTCQSIIYQIYPRRIASYAENFPRKEDGHEKMVT